MIKHYNKKLYSIKATKVKLLKFIKNGEIITANDLVDHFGYKLESARVKLYTLAREGLIIPVPTADQRRLSKLGEKRYQYYVKKAEQEDNQ